MVRGIVLTHKDIKESFDKGKITMRQLTKEEINQKLKEAQSGEQVKALIIELFNRDQSDKAITMLCNVASDELFNKLSKDVKATLKQFPAGIV
jgi:hypothetical protein